MNHRKDTNIESSPTRRQFLRAGAGLAAAGAASAWLPAGVPGGVRHADAEATDNFEPYPIPWLDDNLHHNQVPEAGAPPALRKKAPAAPVDRASASRWEIQRRSYGAKATTEW